MPSLEEHIAARLHWALDHQKRAVISTPFADRGLAVGGWRSAAVTIRSWC
jgi:hypothetical protein